MDIYQYKNSLIKVGAKLCRRVDLAGQSWKLGQYPKVQKLKGTNTYTTNGDVLFFWECTVRS